MPQTAPAQMQAPPAWLTLLLATACGLIVANIYYCQPLAGPISTTLGLPNPASGLVVTMTQLGYGLGLLLVVPLGDLFENRRLILGIMAVGTLALAAAAAAPDAATFLAASMLIGVGSVAVQVIVPYAAHLAPEAARGRMVGNVMSGLMLGIMLSRPAASFITHTLGWHAVYLISAIVMVALMLLLRIMLPPRRPAPGLHYKALLASMAGLAAHTKLLRRRAVYHACLFAAFSVFWTTTPLLLARTYHLSQAGIALFALAGVAGAISAPIAGRLADRGWTRPATCIAMAAVALAFLITRIMPQGSRVALALLVLSGVLVDFGATANLVLGQRAIFSLGAEYRARLNGLYMAFFFAGGAAGSAAGGWVFARGGWPLTAYLGMALPGAALAYFFTERSARA